MVLTIGGSDSSGGSGVQADLKTFAALRGVRRCALTAVACEEHPGGGRRLPDDRRSVIASQINAVLDDMPVAAVKTGMFPDAEAVGAVVGRAKGGGLPNLVVDPVLLTEGLKSAQAGGQRAGAAAAVRAGGHAEPGRGVGAARLAGRHAGRHGAAPRASWSPAGRSTWW